MSLLHFLDKLALQRAKGGCHESHLRGELRALGHDHLRSSEVHGTPARILGRKPCVSEVRPQAGELGQSPHNCNSSMDVEDDCRLELLAGSLRPHEAPAQ